MTHWKFVFYLHLTQLQTSNFQFLQLRCISKNEKNRCSRCCCYSVPPPRIRRISRSYFLKHKPGYFSCIAYPSSMLFLTIFGEVMFQFIKINLKCVFLIKFTQCTESDVWNSISSGCTCEVFENSSIRLSNDWNNFYETTDHLQQFRADKFSTFFKSEAFTFSSASLIEFIQPATRNVAIHRKVFAPFLFIVFDRKMIPFFRFHCQKFGSKWRTRVRIESLMAAKSCKEMYGISTKIQNSTTTSHNIP